MSKTPKKLGPAADRVVSPWRACELRLVVPHHELLSWSNLTQEHSLIGAHGILSYWVVAGLGRVWSKVESRSKPLQYVTANTAKIKSASGNTANPTQVFVAKLQEIGNWTLQFCAMEILLNCLIAWWQCTFVILKLLCSSWIDYA